MTSALPWWEKSKAIGMSFLPVKTGWILASEVSLETKFLLCGTYKTQHISYELKKNEPAIIWKLVTCQRILDLNGSIPEPAILSGDTVQPCFESCQLFTTLMCNMCAISSCCAPKLARKCNIEHWLPCGADRREGGVQSRDYQIFWDW